MNILKKRKGFTLVELITTIAIISIVFTIAGVLVINIINNVNNQSTTLTKSNILKTAKIYLEEYKNDINWQKEETSENKITCISINELINKNLLKKDIKNNTNLNQYIIIKKDNNSNIISENFDEYGICQDINKIIEIPTKKYCTTPTYNKNKQPIATENKNGFYFTEDTVKATDAGTYKVTAKLEDNYQWTDGTTSDKSINCTIEKASPTIELSSLGSIYKIDETETIKIKSNVTGKLTLKSSNKDYFTATIIGDNKINSSEEFQEKILINFLSSKTAEGHITITLTPDDTKNYYSTSTTFTIGNPNKHQVEIPTTKYCSNPIYNSNQQKIINQNEVQKGITLYNYEQTDINNYEVTAKLKYGYIWSDGTTENKTITCPIKGSITYNGNGTTTKTDSTINTKDTINLNEEYTTKANFYIKTGYTFNNWNENKDGTVQKRNANEKWTWNYTNKNITLYAQWTSNTYVIKYNANGGTGTTPDSTHKYNEEKKLTKNGFTKTGYTFNGWNTKPDGTGTSYTNEQSVKNLTDVNGATITLYAQWKENILTVVYHSNDATNIKYQGKKITEIQLNALIDTISYSETTVKGLRDVNQTNYLYLTKKGHKFTEYWLVDSATSTTKISQYLTGTGQQLAEAMGKTLKNGSITVNVYAEWNKKTYTIKYLCGDGTGTAPANQTITYGSEIEIAKNSCTPPKGHQFTNWKDPTNESWNAGWKGTWSYDNGEYGITNETLTLTAQYTPKTFTVKYSCGAGTGTPPANQTVTYGSKITIAKNSCTAPTGYQFSTWKDPINESWNANWNGTWSYDNGEYGITNESLTLTAQYTANTYTVTFDPNGGEVNPTSKTVTYASTYGTIPTPTRTGYTFKGWYTSTSGGTKITNNSTVTITTNQTLYAQWTEHTLTIIYYSNGATNIKLQGNTISETKLNQTKTTIKYSENSENGLLNGNNADYLYLTKTNYTFTDNWLVGSATSTTKISQSFGGTGQEIAKAMGKTLEKESITVNVYAEWKLSVIYLRDKSPGSYVAFTGTNDCTGNSCKGISKTYCFWDDNPYKLNGWRIAYVENKTAYLISAGATECICTTEDETVIVNGDCKNSMDYNLPPQKHLDGLHARALKYCNKDYAYGGVCNKNSARSMEPIDFEKITGVSIKTAKANSKDKDGKPIPLTEIAKNDLINNGGYYWMADTFDGVQYEYYTYNWNGYYTNVDSWSSNFSYGLRPVLRMESEVKVTGGSGTSTDPYTISP